MRYLALLRSIEIEHPAAKLGNPALIPASARFNAVPSSPIRPAKDSWLERNMRIKSLELPAEWKEGLLSMSGKGPPAHISEEQWGQIFDDVDYLAEEWGAAAAAVRWTKTDLFGCSPRFARRLDRDGLAMLLEGRAVLSLEAEHAVISNGTGAPHTFRRKMMHGSISFWEAVSAL